MMIDANAAWCSKHNVLYNKFAKCPECFADYPWVDDRGSVEEIRNIRINNVPIELYDAVRPGEIKEFASMMKCPIRGDGVCRISDCTEETGCLDAMFDRRKGSAISAEIKDFASVMTSRMRSLDEDLGTNDFAVKMSVDDAIMRLFETVTNINALRNLVNHDWVRVKGLAVDAANLSMILWSKLPEKDKEVL